MLVADDLARLPGADRVLALHRRVIGVDEALVAGAVEVRERLPALAGRRDHLPVVGQRDVLARLDRDVVDVEPEVDDLAVEVGVDRRTAASAASSGCSAWRPPCRPRSASRRPARRRRRSRTHSGIAALTGPGRASHAGFLTKAGGICNAPRAPWRPTAQRPRTPRSATSSTSLRARQRSRGRNRLSDSHGRRPRASAPGRRPRRCRRGGRSRARAAGGSPASRPAPTATPSAAASAIVAAVRWPPASSDDVRRRDAARLQPGRHRVRLVVAAARRSPDTISLPARPAR